MRMMSLLCPMLMSGSGEVMEKILIYCCRTARCRSLVGQAGIISLPQVADANKLHYVHTARIVEKDPRDVVHVFLYRLNGDETFTYFDGEVDRCEWRTLNNFKENTRDAASYSLVPQGIVYFDTLIIALEHIASFDDVK